MATTSRGHHAAVPAAAAFGETSSLHTASSSLLRASYGSIQTIRRLATDDAVAVAIRNLSRHLSIMVLIWLISFALMIMHITFNQNIILGYNFIYFVPMITGTFYGLFHTIIIVRRLRPTHLVFVSFERMLFMRAQGIDIDNEASTIQYAEYESLPLTRLLLFWSLAIATLLALSALTQLLFFLWLAIGAVEMWHALLPLATLLVSLIAFLYVAQILSALWTAVLASSLVIAAAVIVKACGEQGSGVSWTVLALAALPPEAAILTHLYSMLTRRRRGHILLNPLQERCLLSYGSSLCLMMLDQVMCALAINEQYRSLSLGVLAAAVFLFTVPAVVIANEEANSLACSRGYAAPLPLCKAQPGWAARKSGLREVSPLLGRYSSSLDGVAINSSSCDGDVHAYSVKIVDEL